MGIGTSLGAYFENNLDHHAGIQWQEDTDSDMVRSPLELPETNPNDVVTVDTFLGTPIVGDDPNIIINDSGAIVDYIKK